MKKLTLTAIAVSFLLTACATSGGQPDWIEGAAGEYPQSRYLTAAGSAANPEDAKSRALANLAMIFEVKVEETSRDESSAWQQSNESGIKQGVSRLTARYIDAYTSKLLEGASVVENWFDKKQQRYYSLAVISRSQISTRLRSEIGNSDRYVQLRLSNADLLQDPVARAQMIYSARSALVTREMLQKDLQIVDKSGAGVPTRWTTKMLDARIDAALSKVVVRESVAQDALGELDQLLKSAVTAAGMRYASETPEYDLQGKLDVQDVGWKDGWYWYRGSLQVTLTKIASGKVSASVQWPIKSSGQSQQQSQIRLRDDIAGLLNTKLKSALLFYGMEKPEPKK
ncbi:MAG: LPP20 family lipoprotein [Gammaproteobacteria bacterium]|nr:LPP20 family lipoprotein [Gammaproteobacteria bacterium]